MFAVIREEVPNLATRSYTVAEHNLWAGQVFCPVKRSSLAQFQNDGAIAVTKIAANSIEPKSMIPRKK